MDMRSFRLTPGAGVLGSLLLLTCLASCGDGELGPGSVAPVETGPLRAKAEAHDRWVEKWHTPNYGSHLHVRFTSAAREEVDTYHGHGDSCIWTGTYVASQALRYRVTWDPQARANVIRSIDALTRHLDVTGRDGFIARYVGPVDDPGHHAVVAGCEAEDRCHLVTEGPFAGHFWLGHTSRDQYTGWFLGMAWAYDTVDDAGMRAQIQSNVTRVLDRLIADNWFIIDVDGRPSQKAPNVLPPMQMTWALIGYHITGEQRFMDVFESWTAPDKRLVLILNNISKLNQYHQHYGLNLAHENFLSILRLSGIYDPETHAFLQTIFREQTHRVVHLQHNPWYTSVFLAEGGLDPAERLPYREQIVENLTDFPPAPKFQFGMIPPPPAELDPISVALHELQQEFPILRDIMGTVNLQAAEAYPVRYQCSSGFMFQRSMWAISCDIEEDRPEHVDSGHDYLAAYWLASAYGVLNPGD